MSGDAPTYVITATRRLAATPKRVYDTIADYRDGHPRIVPKQFSGLTVEKGGVGDGTVIRFQVSVLGRTTAFRAVVTEPEPGRVLVETNISGSSSVTTFTVDPGPTAQQSVVTISTVMPSRPGVAGAIERFLTRRVLRPMYEEELTLLERTASEE